MSQTLQSIINSFTAEIALIVAGVATGLLVVVLAFIGLKFMQGDQESTTTGKKWIKSALIGYGMIMLATAIATGVKSSFSKYGVILPTESVLSWIQSITWKMG